MNKNKISKNIKVDFNDIINFDLVNADQQDIYKLTAQISALSLYLLEKKNKYIIPTSSNIDFGDLDEASGIYYNGNITLNDDVFYNKKNTPHNLINFITNIAHECCHLCQDYKTHFLKNKHIYSFDHFDFLIDYMWNSNNDNLKNKHNFFDLASYSPCFYFLQNHELEANKLGFEVMEYILDNCDLTKVDTEKYKKIKDKLKDIKQEFLIDTENRIEKINNIENREKFLSLAQDVISDIFQKHPDFFVEIMSFNFNIFDKTVDFVEVENMIKTIQAFINALEVNYDDKLANQLFEAVKDSTLPEDGKYAVFYKLTAYTNFTPNQEQVKLLTPKCLKANNFWGTLDDLYSSKKQILPVVNNLFDDKFLQIL